MNKYQATLFSNESDIYTALHSNSAKITDVTLRKIAFNRGLIFPSNLSKEVLIEKISDLPFSYNHIREVQDRLATKSSQDVFSVKRIYEEFDIEKLYDVVNKVKENRPKLLGHEKIDHYSGLQTYHISIDYTEFDFRRGKFQQKKLYSGSIIFIVRNGYVSVRYNYTPRISEILNQIIHTYSSTVCDKIFVNEIDLSSIIDTDLRNTFAVHLYDFDGNYKKTGFEYAGLEKVRVSRIKTPLDINGDNLEGNPKEEKQELSSKLLSSTDNENDDDINNQEMASDDDENLTFNINNAAYDGLSLVNAPQIKELCSDGFYRSLIRWKSFSSAVKNYTITFELSFDDKYLGRNIKFRVLYKESNSASTEREKLSDADFDQVMKQLEEKIFLINDFIIEEHTKRYPVTKAMSCETLNQEAG
ncbi:hypothetical protein ACNY68_20970 [Pantoea sp. KXB25]|uniref:hypothetical protein n=1 Tax=unclassified Pantoea TaxID=2630326 RepID=UPI003AB1F881